MYPVSYEVDLDPAPNRWTSFFRIIVAIPWLIVALLYAVAAFVTHVLAWLSVTILGRYPDWLYRFNSGVVRYMARLGGFLSLQTDAWPPFGLGDDPDYPVRVRIAPAAESQSRPMAFFRLLLAVPNLVVVSVLGGIQQGLAVVAWLTIVFRGYLPEAVNSALTWVNGLYARSCAYMMILTDDYPPIGLEAALPSMQGGESISQTPPPPPPASPPAA